MSATLADHVAVISDIIVGLAAFLTAWAALFGLVSWRKEISGRAQYEAARELARCTYRLVDSVEQCRNPFFSILEFPDDYRPGPDPADPQKEARAYQHIYAKRWAAVRESLVEFEAAALEAKVLWGETATIATDELRESVFQVQSAIQVYLFELQLPPDERNRDAAEIARNRLTRLRNQGQGIANPTSQRIDEARDGVLSMLKRRLRD